MISRLLLATLTGRPVRISQIRSSSTTPGLTRHETNFIRLLDSVTNGSQIQFIYARLFPSYFGYALQREMFGVTLETRWRNIYRWTDPLGGPVLSWPHVEGHATAHDRYGPAVVLWNTVACADGCEGHRAERVDGPEIDGVRYRRWVIGPDIRLRDPGLVTDSAFAARLLPRGHSGYPSDRGFDVIVGPGQSQTQLLDWTTMSPVQLPMLPLQP